MTEKGINRISGVNYPMWAWYQWEGKRKKRDMRLRGYAERGSELVQMTIEINDSDVLLSDFDLFHYVLNHWYLPESENDEDKTDENIIEKSWDRIFDLEKEDDGYVYGLNLHKSIQATFWKLKLEQVIKAEVFTAK